MDTPAPSLMQPAEPRTGGARLWLAAAGVAAALAVLLGVFAWYGRPGMVMELANQLWSCF